MKGRHPREDPGHKCRELGRLIHILRQFDYRFWKWRELGMVYTLELMKTAREYPRDHHSPNSLME
jgi:hypothetical protein